MNPLITISIPVYNVEKYVEKSLSSALNQTYDNLEILVIDDKGTDNSMDVIRRIIATHSRGNAVKIIDHGKNQGLGATRNTSIDNARGEYLFFMDSDDEITEDCIATLYSAMQETPVDFVAGSIDEVDDNGKLKKSRIYENHTFHSKFEFHKYQFARNHKKKLHVMLWNKLYDLSFLRKNNLKCIPYQKNEDEVFSFQLYLKLNSCKLISANTYLYNIGRPNSTSNSAKLSYDDVRYRQDKDLISIYASNLPEIRKYATSKLILSWIIMMSCLSVYRTNRLETSIQEKEKIKASYKKLISINFSEIVKDKASLFFWSYLNGPSLYRKICDILYFEKTNIF